jgi:hypothetical protein
MKKGDSLYCKKSLIHKGNSIFVKNKIYKIKILKVYYIEIEDENGFGVGFNMSLNKNLNEYKFHDHFIDIKESRKLKIEKLNESR